MLANRCGVCNYEIPVDHVRLMIREKDGTFTHYHMACGTRAKGIKPCEDCGYHRLLCSDCAEVDSND
jgi:hypothetical protein